MSERRAALVRFIKARSVRANKHEEARNMGLHIGSIAPDFTAE